MAFHGPLPKRGRNSFRKTEIRRVMQAVQGAGLNVERVEIDIEAGKMIVITGLPPVDVDDGKNPWDEVLNKK